MKSKILIALIIMALFAFIPASVYAQAITLRFGVGSSTYTRNGTPITIEAAPFNQDGRVMVPLRAIGEALNATFAFENNTAIVDTGAFRLELPIGVSLAGGMGTPVIVEGRTFVPLGFIAETIGATPRWDGGANAAYIYINATTSQPPATLAAAGTDGQRNAVRMANEYLEIVAFSRVELIEQLMFAGLTSEDATFGADNSGANWYNNAIRRVHDYLEFMPFDRNALIELLMSEGFTRSQAEHGVNVR